jgi:hypothetical protein
MAIAAATMAGEDDTAPTQDVTNTPPPIATDRIKSLDSKGKFIGAPPFILMEVGA